MFLLKKFVLLFLLLAIPALMTSPPFILDDEDGPANITIRLKEYEVQYIMNPHYPNRVPANYYYQWAIFCPLGHNCKLYCPIFDLHESFFCQLDRMLISNTGNKNMFGAQKVCGKLKNLYALSEEQVMTIAFVSYASTDPQQPKNDARFICEVSSKAILGPCDCGKTPNVTTTNRVAVETGRDVFYDAVLLIAEVGTSVLVCSATAISQKFVLTAAHCVKKSYLELAVIYRVFNLQKLDDAKKIYRIERVTQHPEYNEATFDNNIAVIELKGRLPLIMEPCLPFKFNNVDLSTESITSVGFGLAFAHRETLQEIDMEIDDYYPREKPLWMCTKTLRDVCAWNSGGPVFYKDSATNGIYLIGLLSHNRFINHTLYEYDLKFAPYLDWILTITLEDYCEY